MTALTLKNIPPRLYRRLKASASAHRRSLNSEALFRLEHSLGASPVDPVAALARVDALRDRLRLPPLTERLLKAAKGAGRP